MKPIKLPHLLFSLAVIAALVAAAIPAAPAYALSSGSATDSTVLTADNDASSDGGVVCKSVVKIRDGKRVVVRVCRRVRHRPDAGES